MKVIKIRRAGYAIIAFILFSCTPQNNQEALKDQIAELKKEEASIKEKIELLSSQLEPDTLSVDESIPVSVKTISYESFNHFFEANGSVEAVQDAFISPQISGQVNAIHVKEGQRVSKGTLLISLDTQIIDGTIDEVKNGLDLARKIFNKQKKLWDQNIGSEIQFLEAKNSMESLEKKLATLDSQKELALVRAPFSGIIDEINVKKGELAGPGMRVLQLVNLEKLNINADISEAYLSKIRQGEKVEVTFPSYPDINIELPVSRIGNIVNVENRTFRVELNMNNEGEKLKPNILALLKINDFSTDTALVVPSIIIKQDIKGSFLFVSREVGNKQVAEKIYVNPGISYQSKTMVESGLHVGDKIIISGYNMISNGIGIKEVI